MEALMARSTIVRIHLTAAVAAVAVIVTFLISSTITELIGTSGEVHALRHDIMLGLPLLVACLATAALTGRRLGGRSRAPVVRRKQRRMQLIAAVGLVVLVPCAVILNYRALGALEITELAAGGLNLALLGLNFRDGRALSRPRRGARRGPTGPAEVMTRPVVDTAGGRH
jgi:hypothetical protein